jgi:uncharacterized protein YkwD
MTKRTIDGWRRLGLAITASALLLTVAAVAAIAVVSAPAEPGPAQQVAGSSGLDPAEFNRNAARLDLTITPSPSPQPTLEPTPQPTPEPTPAPVTAAPAPVTARPVPQPAAVPPPPPPPTPAPTSDYRNDIADQLLGLLNNARAQNGVGPVALNSILVSSAQYYVKLHFTTANPYQLNHYLDGGPGDRAWSRGYCCAVGEILVTSEGSAQGMVDLWMSSPSHHAVIVDPQYHEVGISCYGGLYVGADGSTSHPVICSADFGAGGG